jgi:hypothetical protein
LAQSALTARVAVSALTACAACGTESRGERGVSSPLVPSERPTYTRTSNMSLSRATLFVSTPRTTVKNRSIGAMVPGPSESIQYVVSAAAGLAFKMDWRLCAGLSTVPMIWLECAQTAPMPSCDRRETPLCWGRGPARRRCKTPTPFQSRPPRRQPE